MFWEAALDQMPARANILVLSKYIFDLNVEVNLSTTTDQTAVDRLMWWPGAIRPN